MTISAELAAAREVLKGLQTDMRDAGFYTGELDGLWGSLSKGAWREVLLATKLRNDASVPLEPPEETGRALAWGKGLEELEAFAGRPGSAQKFRDRVFWIADDLQMPATTGASDLMSCIAWESNETFAADVKNMAGSGATGLIQFMPTTAIGLGTTTAKLAAMTPEDQLNYVYKYFRPWKGKLKNLGDLYMAILWPLGVGKSDSFVLWEKGERPTTYRQNAGLDVNKDNRITRGEAVSKVLQKVARGHQPDRLWKEAA